MKFVACAAMLALLCATAGCETQDPVSSGTFAEVLEQPDPFEGLERFDGGEFDPAWQLLSHKVCVASDALLGLENDPKQPNLVWIVLITTDQDGEIGHCNGVSSGATGYTRLSGIRFDQPTNAKKYRVVLEAEVSVEGDGCEVPGRGLIGAQVARDLPTVTIALDVNDSEFRVSYLSGDQSGDNRLFRSNCGRRLCVNRINFFAEARSGHIAHCPRKANGLANEPTITIRVHRDVAGTVSERTAS